MKAFMKRYNYMTAAMKKEERAQAAKELEERQRKEKQLEEERQRVQKQLQLQAGDVNSEAWVKNSLVTNHEVQGVCN